MDRVGPRTLTTEEVHVLRDVRSYWGAQNTRADVFISDRDEAVLFVKDRDSTMPLCIVLTNVGRWRAEGTLSAVEYWRHIMGPAADGRSGTWVTAACWLSRIRGLILGWQRDA